MKAEIFINGKETEIELTESQAQSIAKAFSEMKKDNRPITERIKTYEDACADQGISPLTLDQFSFLPEKDREYHFNDHQQVIIKRALNEGWEPDYTNSSEPKYTIWYKSVGSGSGFVFAYYDVDGSVSHVGARHEFKSRALGEYFAKQFLNQVNACFIIKKSY